MGIELACRLRFLSKLPGECSLPREFWQLFPTRFVIDQVGAHVFATIDWFLFQSCGHRDGQQVLWLDVEGLCLPRKLDVQ